MSFKYLLVVLIAFIQLLKIPKVFETHGLKTPVFSSGNNIPRMMRHHKAGHQYNLGTTNTDLKMFDIRVPVVLFDTPGISRCRSQHISVESSSLLHHSIYL